MVNHYKICSFFWKCFRSSSVFAESKSSCNKLSRFKWFWVCESGFHINLNLFLLTWLLALLLFLKYVLFIEAFEDFKVVCVIEMYYF